MTDRDFWADFCDDERDAEAEHVAAVELAKAERLDEKGLPHHLAFLCEPDECGREEAA